MPDSNVTICGLPIESCYNFPTSVFASKGPVVLIEFTEETAPIDRMCRTCFPVVKMEPETSSMFGEMEGY